LTEDAGTIEAFVPSLDPDIMPIQGSRPDLALTRALQLLEQAAIAQGHILMITDGQVNEADREVAREIRSSGHRLSVLGVGTAAGAPLRDSNGQFLQQSNGAIVVPRLDLPGLSELAEIGGGVAVKLLAGNQDLDLLETVRRSLAIQGSGESSAERQYWIEYAPWGVWVLGMLLMLFVLVLHSPHAQSEWADWWQSPEQRALSLHEKGDHETLINNAPNARWKALGHFNQGDFQAASEAYAESQKSLQDLV